MLVMLASILHSSSIDSTPLETTLDTDSSATNETPHAEPIPPRETPLSITSAGSCRLVPAPSTSLSGQLDAIFPSKYKPLHLTKVETGSPGNDGNSSGSRTGHAAAP